MWQLDYPWLLLLVVLPGIGYRYLPAYREARSAVRVPFFAAMSQAAGQVPDLAGGTRDRGQLLLNALVWVLLVLALARPVWIEPPIEHQQPMRDLMLAIDISQSMETRDFTDAGGNQVDRLSAVKQVVQDFIQRRKDDRLGLIVFGSGAYPQAPLTLDHASLAILLADTGIGMAGPNTAIGDAIGLSVKLLEQAHETEKVLILLTDGNDTSSAITPEHAAAMAAAKDVVIHTIGIGDPNADGEAKVNLAGLQQIAKATGGRFFRAEDRTALDQVYSTLDQLTPHQVKILSHQPKRELFWLPVATAIALLAVYHLGAWLRPRLHLSQKQQRREA
ncbi:vWA domain-containing protein [Pseudomonas gingeri]|uniref:vWA domain-containing protein n=1 Tax=Pseudomonas gingeri TaxID=117681 RepID=UPI0015A29571|nr:VWA domain-containing protein [Pseudomonas gingeri]NWA02653.1 VWA domain-containing protein [Pseudomonas gingeri]NWA12174.1 VWA domain-containing protein [Pseudomonas gingeri]NWA57420.1 VWA domain-containing protein [Pseudomonas gingeri]NWA93763.1 VWA domain-containing protein [Pseudomonas gingeri]NWB03235.1 VWA domain-containing protein [Pseudomonas gingeri]